ncbi:hypothetical protein Tco_0138368 [Tanacetum coccineum]
MPTEMELILEQTQQEHAEYDESNTYVLERFNTTAGNPVKEILLKLNLPDHMSILTDSKVTPTKHGRMTKPYSSPRFIANCFIRDSHKDGHGELQKVAIFKAFQVTISKKGMEHVGPKVTSSQDGKVYKMTKRDYAWLMISRCSRSHFHIQVKLKEQAQA